jgi:hypothetical protein
MALTPCSECQKEISDKALACPHCGLPLSPKAPSPWVRRIEVAAGVAVLALIAGVGLFAARHRHDYDRVDELREDQDARGGTHNEHVRQRSFRLYREHPGNAMYAYLWARCIDDPEKQLAVAEEGLRADPRFAWNYNVGAHALSRLHRVGQAYDMAVKGAELDPASMQLADKRELLKIVVDRKLADQGRPGQKGMNSYRGLFRGILHSPSRADLGAIEKSKTHDGKGPVSESVRGFSVCANPVADACVRAYVPADATFGNWPYPATDVTAIKDRQVVAVAGSFIGAGAGEVILLADSVTVEP